MKHSLMRSVRPARVGRRAHGPGVLNGVGGRLLHRDVLPGLQRREDVVVVEVGRREDLDGVERRVVQQRVEVGEERRPPVLRRLPPDDLVGVAHRDDLTPRVQQVPLTFMAAMLPAPSTPNRTLSTQPHSPFVPPRGLGDADPSGAVADGARWRERSRRRLVPAESES